MNPETDPNSTDDMLPEYDFSGGVRGKHYEAYQKSTNIVVLDPDVAEIFKDSAAVNEALRMLAKVAKSLPAET
ncbi:hypothetical protein XM38_021060 [Halomicronema hongdechloris C2206]|uniref:Uncharacterized protein n=1 Tax=Halomicronema hongdechloris C2206 TaxID=1641165 RepID=A0A1Z3HLK9_9CYAN|nr:hypothetical protein [Halomicronema hongdechloris]ASC71156.1 hypothetical protein XM38_021060 [Halomicronema hongdechloris C2206]